ncbi:tannase/feruloyl esterase family alpha/beta hydrolase [Kitasatospora sp. MBT66]|uniref:tannase/feruloyl esterase family alpha/beta hydrolase n=1 Tax=Kitasatospora sp. MBT66 TaxID=1444769 RepID=UPI0005B921A4|nr:tannase/feruloyl esterase family alpha/beta hydrolase [Kitasatospora sp. MBT66]
MLRRLAVAPLLLATVLSVPAGAADQGDRCSRVRVPGAEYSVSSCLADLTSTGTRLTGHTQEIEWKGLLADDAVLPSGVPGIQVDGYFPDTSTTNTDHGWNHDSQFVIRLPKHWNGGLVVAGPPGTRRQYANDPIIGDQVLAKGYAYAATDKGNTGDELYQDGDRPGDAIMEWHRRVAELTVAAKEVARQHYGRAPGVTYAAGLSAGGYLVRWQLEHYPELYTGGIDWNALVFTKDGGLLATLPPALRAFPRLVKGDQSAREEIIAAGYPKDSESQWGYHYNKQWDLLQRVIREEVDPDYDGDRQGGTPFCPPGSTPGCDTDYDFASRPESVHRAVERISLTGNIKRPLISIQGTLDALTPPATFGDVYDRMVTAAGRAPLHRYVHVPGGTHTDGLVVIDTKTYKPMLPSFVAAFNELEGWARPTTRS